MAILTVNPIVRTGLTPALVAAAVGGDSFPNDGRTFVEIVNGHTSPQTATFATVSTVDGLAVADLAVAVTNAQRRFIGPFPPEIYNDANGRVQMTYSGVTALTLNPFRL